MPAPDSRGSRSPPRPGSSRDRSAGPARPSSRGQLLRTDSSSAVSRARIASSFAYETTLLVGRRDDHGKLVPSGLQGSERVPAESHELASVDWARTRGRLRSRPTSTERSRSSRGDRRSGRRAMWSGGRTRRSRRRGRAGASPVRAGGSRGAASGGRVRPASTRRPRRGARPPSPALHRRIVARVQLLIDLHLGSVLGAILRARPAPAPLTKGRRRTRSAPARGDHGPHDVAARNAVTRGGPRPPRARDADDPAPCGVESHGSLLRVESADAHREQVGGLCRSRARGAHLERDRMVALEVAGRRRPSERL
jgi:hypothetical protein